MNGLRLCVLVLLAGVLLVAEPAAGMTMANFDDGNTSAQVDGYPGTPGDGWSNAWVESTEGGASFTTGPTVVSTSPFPAAGGNYLTATFTSGGANTQATVSRSFADANDIDNAQPHVVSFQFRPEDLTGFTNNEDRFFLFDRTSARGGTDSSVSWMILAAGGTRGDTNWNANEWFVFDGNKDGGGFYVNRYVNSGIPLVGGTDYSFTVAVHPSAQEWDVTISDGASSFTAKNLGFRINATEAGSALNFGGRASSGSDSRSYSMDSLHVFLPDTIRAEFDAGTGGANPDQFSGTGGKGWVAKWTGEGGTSSIETSDPLEGPGDPYVQVSRSASGPRTIRRQYESYGTLDPARKHWISWKWRFDGDPDDLTVFDDRIHFFGDDVEFGSTKSSNSWIVGCVAADRPGNDIHDGKWYFFDGTGGSGFVGSNMVNTGMDLLPDTVYDFRVLVDPIHGT